MTIQDTQEHENIYSQTALGVGYGSWGLCWLRPTLLRHVFFNAPGSERVNSAAYIQSLSDSATLALVILFATGAYSGWRSVRSRGDLLESGYGQILLLKLALVFVAAALGGHNRVFEMPKLSASLKNAASTSPVKPLKRFSAVLHIESVVLTGVLAAAAVLVSSPLPGTS